MTGSQIGLKKCHILEECIRKGDNLYAMYVYTPTKDLGIQADDSVNSNVYAMATYTDSSCTVKNTVDPRAVLSSSCLPSTCCETTMIDDSETTVTYMVLEEASYCPSDGLGQADPSANTWTVGSRWVVVMCLAIALGVYGHAQKRATGGGKASYYHVPTVEIPSHAATTYESYQSS